MKLYVAFECSFYNRTSSSNSGVIEVDHAPKGMKDVRAIEDSLAKMHAEERIWNVGIRLLSWQVLPDDWED